ncbi:MAG TPA: DUF3014 domain-containing protein [Vicinamibacterales bacterium]|nr:DUF3014 domain-containing protein [Vicinamibacterales bacterium]
MADIADLRLSKPGDPRVTPPRRGGRAWLPIAIIVLVLAGVAAYVWWPRRQAPPSQVAVQQTTTPTRPAPVAVPPADIDVPALDETDPLVRQLVSQLSSHPKVAAWLTTDHLIRNFTVVVANIAEGKTPATHLRTIRPDGAFSVQDTGTQTIIDPASYRRYDGYADAFAALDPEGAARLYATLKPRITEAYRDLGYPEGDFDTTLARAIGILLRTPVIDDPIVLRRKSVTYAFADPDLEALAPVQRQFLRMGPRNVRMIQQKLREIARYVGIDPDNLPKS